MPDETDSRTSAPSPPPVSAETPATERLLPHTSIDIPTRPHSSGPRPSGRLPPLRTVAGTGPRQSGVHSILNPSDDANSRAVQDAEQRQRRSAQQGTFIGSPGANVEFRGSREGVPEYFNRTDPLDTRYAETSPLPPLDTRPGTSESEPHRQRWFYGPGRAEVPGWTPGPYGAPPSSHPSKVESPRQPATGFQSFDSRSTLSSPQYDIRRRSSERSESQSDLVLTQDPASHQNLQPQAAGGRAESSSGYPMMTIQTDQGPYSVPIDVQAASRVADEKRKRNAGASARFRARRKEKEVASTKEIDDLKKQISDLSIEVAFYRRERDTFAKAVYDGPERDRYFPRPPSPRSQQMSRQPQTPHLPRLYSYGDSQLAVYQSEGERGSGGRITRRRVSRDLLYSETPSPTYPSTLNDPRTAGSERPGEDPRSSFASPSSFQSRDSAFRVQAEQAQGNYDPNRPPAFQGQYRESRG